LNGDEKRNGFAEILGFRSVFQSCNWGASCKTTCS
jgi:hypothetical protein